MRRGSASPHINEQLLQELVYAGLNAPGFSEAQRVVLLEAAGGPRMVPASLPPWASYWPFEVLGPRIGFGGDVIEVIDYL